MTPELRKDNMELGKTENNIGFKIKGGKGTN
jgi:hypothetical protein